MTSTMTDNVCGFLGNSIAIPFTATRQGDAPPQVSLPLVVPTIAAPPAVPPMPLQTIAPKDEQLLIDLADHGVTASDFPSGSAEERVAAKAVCTIRGEGTSVEELLSKILADPTSKLSAEQARWLVKLATQHLCPQYG